MCKICSFCRLRGNSCRVIFALFTAWTLMSQVDTVIAESIQNPGVPTPAMPPSIAPDHDPSMMRKRAKDEKSKEQIQSKDDSDKKLKDRKALEKAYAESHEPRPLYGFAEVSLLLPKAIVSSGRSNYVPDLTSHLSAYVRTSWGKGAETVQPWVGLRIAPFGGYGTQDRLTARYAHTWIGPSFGFGRIPLSDAPLADSPIRFAYLWSTGIAAVSRMAVQGESSRKAPTDFRPTPWSMDPPGIWSELRITRISMGAFGLGFLGGAQTGAGKIFIYGGLTATAFY